MKIIAAYRMYYGEDYIRQSIESIYDHVDQIIIWWTDRPWGDVREAKYKGTIIKIPNPIDGAMDILDQMKHQEMKKYGKSKICLVYNTFPTSENLLTELYNDMFLYKREGNIVMFLEPDMIFDKKGIIQLTNYMKMHKFGFIYTQQVEFWKTHEYRVPDRDRPGVICFDLREDTLMPKTGKNCMPYVQCDRYNDVTTYNFGYCLSPKNMYWKIIVTLAFTTVVHDSLPDENWYEDTWLNWDYETNNKNLEISKNYRHYLPRADKYVGPLPETYLKYLKHA
jgi:hypothetical protein